MKVAKFLSGAASAALVLLTAPAWIPLDVGLTFFGLMFCLGWGLAAMNWRK